MCSVDDGIFSMSRNAFSMGSWCGRKSWAWRKCKIDCWKCPYALKISPSVKYCRQAFRSGDCTSNERRVKWMASSKYCKLNSTLARLCSTSEFDGEIDRARRKQSIDFVASPLMRQKFPIWLNKCIDIGFSRFAFFSRLSNTSMLKFFKLFDCLFLRNWNATCTEKTIWQINFGRLVTTGNQIQYLRTHIGLWHDWMIISLSNTNQIIIKCKIDGTSTVQNIAIFIIASILIRFRVSETNTDTHTKKRFRF